MTKYNFCFAIHDYLFTVQVKSDSAILVNKCGCHLHPFSYNLSYHPLMVTVPCQSTLSTLDLFIYLQIAAIHQDLLDQLLFSACTLVNLSTSGFDPTNVLISLPYT